MEAIYKKRKIAGLIIIKEMMDDDEEEEVLLRELTMCRKEVSDVFRNRRNEGAFNILIKSHLHCEEVKFQNYFRFFSYIYSVVVKFK